MKPGENKCSFCGKPQWQVRLIAGPGVFICHLCVALCNEILAQEMPGEGPRAPERAQPEPPPPSGSGPLTRTQVRSSTKIARPEIAGP